MTFVILTEWISAVSMEAVAKANIEYNVHKDFMFRVCH